MVDKSNITFIEGNAIDVGAAGDNDFEFEEGDSIVDGGESTIAFVEGVGIGGVSQIIDDFEDGDLDEYDYVVDGSTVDSTSPVWEGNYSLKLPMQLGSNNDAQTVSISGGLPYPTQGDVFGGYVFMPEVGGERNEFRYVFAAQQAERNTDGYHAMINRNGYAQIEVNRRGDILAQGDGGIPSSTWLDLEITWSYDADTDTTTIRFVVRDANDGSVYEDIQGQESPTTHESGGVAFNADGNGEDMAFDFAEIR